MRDKEWKWEYDNMMHANNLHATYDLIENSKVLSGIKTIIHD